MPRYVRYAPITSKRRVKRQSSYRVSGYKKFIDPFPLGFGTLPEKIVYAALSRLGIEFYYLNDLTFSDPAADYLKIFQADFYIPGAKLIIEVQGEFWHSKPKTIESDAFKFAVYETFGFKVLAWWENDILYDVMKLITAEPLLLALAKPIQSKSGELTPLARTKTDSSKGIRTLNQRRAQRLSYRKKAVTMKRGKAKVYGSYNPKIK